MITLYKFPRVWGLPCMSPYCMKVESYLRLRGIEHQVRVGDLRKAPRGQLPWIDDDGRSIGESTLIIEHFESRQAEPLDAALSEDQRARGWGMVRTLEESTVWALRHQRFIDPTGWAQTREVLKSIVPAPLRAIAPSLIRRQMAGALRAQGSGRFEASALYGFAKRDFDAAAQLLGDRQFLFGDKPTSFDLSLFGFVASFASAACRSPVTEHVLGLPNLLAHNERMRERLYPEFASWIAAPQRAGCPEPARSAEGLQYRWINSPPSTRTAWPTE